MSLTPEAFFTYPALHTFVPLERLGPPMMGLLRRRSLRLLVAVIASLAITAVAFAAWTASGTGSSTAKATSAVALTTSDASASTTATLYPGATGSLRITINNPNPYPVRITTIAAGSGSVSATGGIGTCSTTGVSLVPQSGLALDVAANGSSTFTVSGAVTMDNTSDNGCQGATFTVPVSLSGASNA
jgi:hypothetical protein